MKLEIVVDASGLPLGLAAAGANVSEQALLVPALNDIPVDVPAGTPTEGTTRTRCGTRSRTPGSCRSSRTARAGSGRRGTTVDGCGDIGTGGWSNGRMRGSIVTGGWQSAGPTTRSCTLPWCT
jgi:hypothetical protein